MLSTHIFALILSTDMQGMCKKTDNNNVDTQCYLHMHMTGPIV